MGGTVVMTSILNRKINRRKAISKLAVGVIGAAAAVAVGGTIYYNLTTTRPKDSIVFGSSLSLSGPLKPIVEESYLPLYNIWKDMVNSKGGFYISELNKSLPIELRIYDDGSDTAKVSLLYQKLILEDKVDFLLPPWGTAWEFAAAVECEKNKRVLVMGIEGGDPTKLITPYDYVFFTSPWRPPRVAKMLADFMSNYNINSAAITTAQTDFTVDQTKFLVEELNRRKIEIRYRTEYPLDIKDATSILSAIADTKAEAILFMCYPADSVVLANALLRRSDIKPKIVYFLLGPSYQFFVNTFRDKLEGMMVGMSTNKRLAGEKIALWSSKLKEKGVDWDWIDQPIGIAGLEIMEQAITRASSLDHKKVQQVLATSEFDTIMGKIRYERMDGKWWVSTATPRIGQWIKGELKQVWPLDAKEADPVIPYSVP